MKMFDTSSRKKFVASFPESFTVGAEVGVSSGDFAKNILTVTKNVKLYCVDIWEQNYQLPDPERSYKETFNNLIPFGAERFELVREGSPKSALRFEDEFFDFVYIDADHHYEPVLEDLKAWYPKVKSGGVFFGHDYNQPWDGVVNAVNEFFAEKGYEVGVISSVGYADGDQDGGSQSWYVIKK
jgi:SAM-dependent methyltransferase